MPAVLVDVGTLDLHIALAPDDFHLEAVPCPTFEALNSITSSLQTPDFARRRDSRRAVPWGLLDPETWVSFAACERYASSFFLNSRDGKVVTVGM